MITTPVTAARRPPDRPWTTPAGHRTGTGRHGAAYPPMVGSGGGATPAVTAVSSGGPVR